MSQRDLVAELRAAHVEAPPEVRDRVRAIAADAPTPAPRFTWRRALVVAVPVAAAIAASIVFTRPSPHKTTALGHVTQTVVTGAPPHVFGNSAGSARAMAVPFTPYRVQTYGADLTLREPTAAAVSKTVSQALRIANALGGYPVAVHVATHGKRATASLSLKIPRRHVQQAITRLSALGTITAEQVDITDREAGLNATDREIAQLRKQLKNAPPDRVAALTSRIQALQRSESATRRTAHYATISLHLATPAATAKQKTHWWRDAGWAAAGALALAVLLLIARFVRRYREDALLSRR